MAPPKTGWLDIHGHFFLPRPESEDASFVKSLRDAHFMVSEAPRFDPEAMMAYNDRAGISMQMLSYLPPTTSRLRMANDFGLSIVQKYPSRFGLLAGLPTDEPEEALKEIQRFRDGQGYGSVQPDGFAVTTVREGTGLGDRKLRGVWDELDKRREVVFVHPNAYTEGQDGRPSALIDVAFDTARTITDMVYSRVFLDFPHIKWVFAHCGGAFPALSGRVALLGAQSWVPNTLSITKADIREQIARIYVDTAATAETGMEPAMKMTGIEHIIYGADCGVPCSTEDTMEENRSAVKEIAKRHDGDEDCVGLNGFKLFQSAAARTRRVS
jgi:6-methylsalicylate decarboxylase